MELINTLTKEYPYSTLKLRKDNPNVSFPSSLEGVDLSEFNVAEVLVKPRPEYDWTKEVAISELKNTEEEGWFIDWSVRPLTESEIASQKFPNWSGFNLSMSTNTAKVSYDIALNSINPTLAGKLDIAYNKMSNNEGVIDYIDMFNLYCTVAEVKQEHRDEWAIIAEENDFLPDVVSAIRGTTN